MAKKRRTTESDEEKLYRRIRAMPAAITKDQMREMESAFREDSHGVARRTALAVMANSCAHLFGKIDSDRDVAVAMADAHLAIEEYLVHLRAVTKMMEAASTRFMVGLCNRDDMQEILDEVNAERAGLAVEAGHA